MPIFSLFVLVLWVFLQSVGDNGYKWFAIDPKLVAFVGLVFVVVVIFESLLLATDRMPKLFRKRGE